MVVSVCIDPPNASALKLALSEDCPSGSFDEIRFDAAATAAFSNTANGGLIPQARHDGRGMEALALLGSKSEGTGLEKEQIGHIQVALEGGKDDEALG